MILLRRVIGDALRARRQAQHRTLREVSTAANVSLGYLSEIERGQKEASSELLASICDALGAHLSELLREVSHTVADAEQGARTAELAAAGPVATEARQQVGACDGAEVLAPAKIPAMAHAGIAKRVDAAVSVTVRQDTPLRATLHAVRNRRPDDREREGVLAPA